RTPSRDRLNGWYNTMLARASGLGILSSVDTLWASYFSAYGKREETAVRTASKNSFVSKNSQAIAARRAVNGKAEAPISTATPPTPVCPPVFEGDFWVNECSRVYRLVQMRARGLEGQDRHVNQRRCREMLKQMMSKPTAIAFNQPVDPVLLNIPDYPLIIRNPMDLGTVRDRLRVNAYRTILDFANDIRLTFTNAMAYNPAGHTIHVYAVKLLEDFEAQLVDVVTERIGALLAGSGNIDSWLGGYPLNSEIERELQEKQSADEMAKLANGGFASTGGASGSCDTRRVSFPSSLDDMITSERDDGDDCENWTAGDVSGEYAEGQGSEEDKEEGPQESMDEEEASGDADYLGSDLTN
ncbi:GTE10, partial [Symbiodinium microadriaticum]